VQKIKTRFGQSGRTIIPTEYRQRLGPEVGDEIIDNLDEESLRPYFPAQAVEMVDYLPPLATDGALDT
jgi:bifunctional DNA-binding transcriptional regulator/antitoxin component of YhaV-PrlF toxin-antitoxin module